MVEIITKSPEETEEFGKKLASMLLSGDIISFKGDLGAGKTCMIRGISRGLGVKSNITSSSFVLMRVLEGEKMVYHFDLYRLSDREELLDIGYDEFMFSDGISLVEWPEKMGDWIGNSYLEVNIKYDFDTMEVCDRVIRLVPHGKRFEELLEKLVVKK